jgi:hypothetical protein
MLFQINFLITNVIIIFANQFNNHNIVFSVLFSTFRKDCVPQITHVDSITLD